MSSQTDDAKYLGGMLADVPGNEHVWVTLEGDDIAWCRWCGRHKVEVTDKYVLVDNTCDYKVALERLSKALSSKG